MGGGAGVPRCTRAAELGFLGLKYPGVELGGQGSDYVHDAVWAEQLAGGRVRGVGAGLGAHTGIATPRRTGSAPRPARALSAAGDRGPQIAALGITEPGAGPTSHRSAPRRARCPVATSSTVPRRSSPNGVRADFLVCAVKTTPDGGHQGISFLILEREMPGYEVSRKLEKMGWHSSDTGELSFTDVEVPDENLLGEENRGFLIMENFAWERLLMALGAVGGMRRLLDVAISYAGEREAFGRPIGSFQAIRHKIAEVGVKAEVGRALTYHALRRFVAGNGAIADVTKAKLYTQRACVEVADEVLQILGGYGYMREYGVERALRDARLGPIGGGTGRGHEGDPRPAARALVDHSQSTVSSSRYGGEEQAGAIAPTGRARARRSIA